ncbi:MAG: dienelactone hydrolase family protein [Gemmatimonadaceae bacterium]|nr:dienelactone hydrolase family protein [Gemmatimonadaceae bacterium]
MILLRRRTLPASLATIALLVGCSSSHVQTAREHDEHMGHDDAASAGAGAAATHQPTDASLPAGSATVAARLASSSRHGEYVMVARAPGSPDSVRAWVVYPERRDKAPVVVVVHEIFGLSTWIRGVADQLAAEGYIAIAPDLISGKYTLAPGDTITQAQASALIRTLVADSVQRDIARVAEYAMALPSAQQKFGVVGFCWGGSTSFATAVQAHPRLRASVVYYGGAPALAGLSSVRAPVLGLYGENDARVNATIAGADSTMKALKKSFEPVILAGAGHGFLRQQDGQNGANLAATRAAWPRTVAFFQRALGR